jgi:hypothetical protein
LREFIDVDRRELHVPPSRITGADPIKLQRQIRQFGPNSTGMPDIWCYRGSDAELVIWNGVTRATPIAKLAPGTLVHVEVIGTWRRPVGHLPKIGDLIP